MLICFYQQAGKQWLHTTMASRRKKVFEHFNDLETCYFDIRQPHLIPSTSTTTDTKGRCHSVIIYNGLALLLSKYMAIGCPPASYLCLSVRTNKHVK